MAQEGGKHDPRNRLQSWLIIIIKKGVRATTKIRATRERARVVPTAAEIIYRARGLPVVRVAAFLACEWGGGFSSIPIGWRRWRSDRVVLLPLFVLLFYNVGLATTLFHNCNISKNANFLWEFLLHFINMLKIFQVYSSLLAQWLRQTSYYVEKI